MPTGPGPRREPTDDWDQLRLLVASPEQEAYELLRPIVLFGQPASARAREAGVAERTLRRKAARFAEMGANQIGDLTAGVLTIAVPEVSNSVEFFPGVVKKWGLGAMLTTEQTGTGRAAGSLTWGGIANTYFWLDPTRRVTGVLLTQILPFADPGVLDLLEQFERAVYAGSTERGLSPEPHLTNRSTRDARPCPPVPFRGGVLLPPTSSPAGDPAALRQPLRGEV